MIQKELVINILYNVITSEINDIQGDYDGFMSAFKGKEVDEVIETILYGVLSKFNDNLKDEV